MDSGLYENRKVNVVITDTATDANGCFCTFGEGQTAGKAGFSRSIAKPLVTSMKIKY